MRKPNMQDMLRRHGLRSEPHPHGYPKWRFIFRGEQSFGEIHPRELWRRLHAKEAPFEKRYSLF